MARKRTDGGCTPIVDNKYIPKSEESPKLKLGREYPFAVRKVPWDGLWHVQYFMRNPDGKIRKTWDRVKFREAMRASKKLVNQGGLLPYRLQGEL